MVTRRTTVCENGILYVIVFGFVLGGAILREINLLMVVAAILVGPMLLSLRYVARALSRVTVQRSLPHGIGASEVFDATLTVSNGRRRGGSWGMIVTDHVRRVRPEAGNSTESVSVLFPYLEAGEHAQATYDGRFHERGEYQFGPLEISTRFPLGLWRRVVRFDRTARMFVYPQLGSLTRKWSLAVFGGIVGSQRSQNRIGWMEGEFHSLRDYRRGDSRRWIHWRTTAKRNQLTVRQFERHHNQDVAVFLELRVGVNHAADDEEHVETAIRFVASIVASQCRRGSSRLTVGIAGKTPARVSGVTSAGLLQEAMEKLAVAQSSQQDQMPQLLATELKNLHAETRVVIVSTCPINISDTDRFADAWDKPRRRAMLSRMLCIDVSSGEHRAYFDPAPDGPQPEFLEKRSTIASTS